MKKTQKTAKKLELRTETLLRLDDWKLEQARGGTEEPMTKWASCPICWPASS